MFDLDKYKVLGRIPAAKTRTPSSTTRRRRVLHLQRRRKIVNGDRSRPRQAHHDIRRRKPEYAASAGDGRVFDELDRYR